MKIVPNRSHNRKRIRRCSGDSGSQGVPQNDKEAKMKKRRVVSNSVAVFYTILHENLVQDGTQNRSKIENQLKRFSIF